MSGKFAKSLAAELKVAACFTNFHRIREDTQGIVMDVLHIQNG